MCNAAAPTIANMIREGGGARVDEAAMPELAAVRRASTGADMFHGSAASNLASGRDELHQPKLAPWISQRKKPLDEKYSSRS